MMREEVMIGRREKALGTKKERKEGQCNIYKRKTTTTT